MKRVLVLCPNVWDKEALAHPYLRDRYEMVFAGGELLEHPGLFAALTFDVFRYTEALVRLGAREKVVGVVGTGDYPGCMLAAMVAERLGLPGSPPREIVQLSHKVFSRQIQERLIPEATARFAPLDPRRPQVDSFPRFVKPVKGTMSIRARLVRNPAELTEAVRFSLADRLRAHLLLKPFQALLGRYSDGKVPATYFIAEEPLQGEQVTVDGFIQEGQVTIMGVVDSVMYPGTMSFERFEYPSRLPAQVQARMAALVTRLISGSGLDHTCFNVELFFDPATEAITVIEVNPRMSYQFGDLYERVDGTHTYALQLCLASGEPAQWKARSGKEGAAASFVMRRFTDARVVKVPSAASLSQVAKEFPGASVKILCREGERLSAQGQDVESFRYAIINMGAADAATLQARYARLKARLPFHFDPQEDAKAPRSGEDHEATRLRSRPSA